MLLTVLFFPFYLSWSQKIRGLDRLDCSKSRFLDKKRPTKGLVRKMQILSLDEIRQNLLDLGVSLGVLSRSLACFHGFSWLLLPSGWVRDSFGTWHEGRDYTTWEETLYHMEVDFVPQRAIVCTTRGESLYHKGRILHHMTPKTNQMNSKMGM